MVKSLITGGAGFIGSHLVEGLLARGHSVRILDDFSSGKADNLKSVAAKVELIDGSVADADRIARAVAGCEQVFHLAAIPSVAKSIENPRAAHEVSATGTLLLLDASRRAGVRRLIYAASSSAYGDQPGAVRTEDDSLIPLSPYAAAKLAGEFYCRCFTTVYGLETVRLRMFNVFGPRQDATNPYSGVIALFINAMTHGKTPTIFGDGLQSRDFVYIEDVVQAFVKAAEVPSAAGNVFNIGTGTSVTVLDLVHHLNEILGTSIKAKHEPARAGDVRFSQADITRARTELGFAPSVSFPEGLRRTVQSLAGA